MNFADLVVEEIKKKNSCVVAGLDPKIDCLPKAFKEKANRNPKAAADVLFAFCREIINIVAQYVVAVKLQIAFFELFGSYGISAFERVCKFGSQKGLVVIADIKRGDISSTADAYSAAYLGKNSLFCVDAVTVNPFFGSDGIEPFLEVANENNKGLFILVRTSNPSSAEFQELIVDGEPIYKIFARRVSRWGKRAVGREGYSSVGAVVGATFPKQGREIRKILSKSFLLIPGYGTQGGKSRDLKHLFNPDGLGAIINASRSISFAYKVPPFDKIYGETNWQKAVEEAVIRMKDELNGIRFSPQ